MMPTMVAAILRQVVNGSGKSEEKAALVGALRRQLGRALTEERWHFADHFCDKILAEDPNHLESWLVKGHLAWRVFNEPTEAVSHFRRVVILGGFESANECVAQARASLARLLAQLA